MQCKINKKIVANQIYNNDIYVFILCDFSIFQQFVWNFYSTKYCTKFIRNLDSVTNFVKEQYKWL